jgi:hypothetical protein
MTFTAWTPGNPDNAGGREHYLTTVPAGGGWNDTVKDWDSYEQAPIVGYICEWHVR